MTTVLVGAYGHVSVGADGHVQFILFEALKLSFKVCLIIKYDFKCYFLFMDDVFNYRSIRDL